MSLGVISPIRNKGLYSDWLSAAPLATSMLTIDTSGNVGSQAIPVAAWGSITGTLSSQTDLQNALNAKLSLSGGTMTGSLAINQASFLQYNTFTSATSFEALQSQWASNESRIGTSVGSAGGTQRDLVLGAWNSAGTFTSRLRIGSTGIVTLPVGAAWADSAYLVLSGIRAWIEGQISIGTSDQNGFTFYNGHIEPSASRGLNARTNVADLGVASSRFRDIYASRLLLFNSYTNTNNYERASFAFSGNVLQIGTQNLGTGIARALELQTAGTTRVTIQATGNVSLADSINLEIATTTGTQIATATGQKLGFYGATPVDRPDTVSDPTGGGTVDAEARTAINAIIDRLQELGLIA